jgi:hypothetical protein
MCRQELLPVKTTPVNALHAIRPNGCDGYTSGKMDIKTGYFHRALVISPELSSDLHDRLSGLKT